MIFRLAELDDLNDLKAFYDAIIDGQKDDEFSAKWTKDVYPCLDDLLAHINNGEYYLGIVDNQIACAAALSFKEDPIYYRGDFKIKDIDQIAVIHLFATGKKYRQTGSSKKMLTYLIDECRKKAMKAIHLDVLIGNLPAVKLYQSVGFDYVGKLNVYYEDTGNIEVEIFELLL